MGAPARGSRHPARPHGAPDVLHSGSERGSDTGFFELQKHARTQCRFCLRGRTIASYNDL
eukprot:6021852-Prymnesium_polylepis.1